MRSVILFCLMASSVLLTSPFASAASYKCKGADGKIEYSDSPCDNSKEALSKPQSSGIASQPLGPPPMAQLEKLFTDYETRLCERERLSTEVDMANRAGEIGKDIAKWKTKQTELNTLNDILVEFQEKAGKITRATGRESPETQALRKFQGKLKECAKPAK